MSSTVMADTAPEVREAILVHIARMNQELIKILCAFRRMAQQSFFSNGRLLTYLDRTSDGNTFEVSQGSIKHIEVAVLVEGQAAVAHFY
jgi:hypothetical protein